MQLKYTLSSMLLASILTACGGSGSDSDNDVLSLDDGSTDATTPDTADNTNAGGNSTDTETDSTSLGTANIEADTDSTSTDTANIDVVADSTDTADINTNTDSTDTADFDTDISNSDTDIVNSDADTGSGNSDDNSVTETSVSSNVITCCLQEDRTAPAPGTVITSATAPVVPNLSLIHI